MNEPGMKAGGVLASLRGMGDSLLGLAQGRLQLFALELQSEQLRLLDLLVGLSLAVALAALGLMVGTAALTIYLWETARYAGLLVEAGVFIGAAALTAWRLREAIRKGPMPFADTVAEFEKDRACLRDEG